MHADVLAGIVPDWAVTGVGALMSTRAGGVSRAPWDTLNVGDAVGDDPLAVAENRRRVASAIGVPVVYLRQVHGARVVRIDAADALRVPIEADAAVTDAAGVACAVQVADCLPVLFAAPDGRAVGAAHAGWRGLAAGVVERTLDSVAALAGCARGEVVAWLGPCIGPGRFEVGADVLCAFGVDPAHGASRRFVPRQRSDGACRWLCDLPGLVRDRLAEAGAGQVGGGRWCTVEQRSAFFSYRRDGVTGRHVAAVWRRR